MTSICKAYTTGGAVALPQTPPEEEHSQTADPGDALVGHWVLASTQPRHGASGTKKRHQEQRVAPWFMRECLVDVQYNADGDLIIHIQAAVGVGIFRRWVDNGFAKIDPDSGVFRCRHTPDNAHNEFRLQQQPDLAECIYYVDGVPQPSRSVRLERRKVV